MGKPQDNKFELQKLGLSWECYGCTFVALEIFILVRLKSITTQIIMAFIGSSKPDKQHNPLRYFPTLHFEFAMIVLTSLLLCFM